MDEIEVAGAGIRSLEKGIGVLRALQTGPSRLNDIAKRCGMSASMAHGYLVSLIRTGFAVQDAQTGLYELGEGALQLGLTALGRTDFLKFARTEMMGLADRLGETVTLAVWGEAGPVVVDKIDGRHDSVYEIRIGSPVRLWPTATGRVFMAHLPEPLWQAHLDRHLAQAGREPGEAASIQALFDTVRSQGLATTPATTLPDFSAIAAPVFDHRAMLKGVVTAIGRAAGFDVEPAGSNAAAVRAATRAISRRLGG